MMAVESTVRRSTTPRARTGGVAAETSVKIREVADASQGDSGVSPASVPVSNVSLGRYRLCFELARGGMAAVYLAKLEGRPSVERFVAVKVVHPHLMRKTEFVEMFLDEARIASRLQHANICRVVDFDADESSGHFIVMEYLEGEPLSAVFRAMVEKTRGSPRHRAARVARVIADACEGLHAAHELTDEHGDPLGIVHRDISPDNIFLTYDGVAKVVDFGLATAAIQRHQTRAGVIKGKYAYLPPEVLSGKKPDRRADIWSMGVVLWELLTQKRLFHRQSDLETVKSIEHPKILAPSQARPGLPDSYDAIVMKALACDPDARYQTARELGRALTHLLARRRIAVGLAELSEWMDELFPAGRACKRQLIEIASRLDETTTVRDPFAPASISFCEKPTLVSDRSAPNGNRGVP